MIGRSLCAELIALPAMEGTVYVVLGLLVNLSVGSFVSEENSYCIASDDIIRCDFSGYQKEVRLDSRVNHFSTVLVQRASQVLLTESLCTSVSLYHVASALFPGRSERSASCEGKALHLHNVTLDHVPPFLEKMTLENSRLTGSFLEQPVLQRLKVVNSWLRRLALKEDVSGATEVRLHRANISSLQRLRLAGSSKLFVTDSVVGEVKADAFSLRANASAEVMRSVFTQDPVYIRIHETTTRILLADIKGSCRILYDRMEDVTKSLKATGESKPCEGDSHGSGNSTSYLVPVLMGVVLAASLVANCYLLNPFRKKKKRRKEEKISKKLITPITVNGS